MLYVKPRLAVRERLALRKIVPPGERGDLVWGESDLWVHVGE